MHLRIEGTAAIVPVGNVEITLPGFMVVLHPDDARAARTSDKAGELVVASGRANDGAIYLFTAANQLHKLQPETLNLPSGTVRPIDCGQTLLIDEAFEVDACLALEHSVLLVAPM